MSVNLIPEVLNDFRVYDEGKDNCHGVVSIEIPEEASLTQTVKGVGIAGEVDAPILGHYGSMETKINWNLPTETAHKWTGGRPVSVEACGALQYWDSANNSYVFKPCRVVIRGRAKSKENGTYEAGNTVSVTNTIETTYLKIEVDGKVIREIDKYGYKDINGDEDMLSEVRAALGI